jgi:hypothetical protein
MMPKLYAVEFKEKKTGNSFVKIGWTKEYDVMDRFSAKTMLKYGHEPDHYDRYEIKVLASAYTTSYDQVKEAEEKMLKKYPKNFWLEEKISGVTEIVKLDDKKRYQLIGDILNYRAEWFKQRKDN